MTQHAAGAEAARRQERAQAALERHRLDLVLATPGTNFSYLTGIRAIRMERLVAFGLPRSGAPFLVCPAFEESNMRRDLEGAEIITWGESEDPYPRLAQVVESRSGKPPSIGIEPTTWFCTSERICSALPLARLVDAGPVFDSLRSAKSGWEAGFIRQAANAAEAAVREARLHLKEGMTEQDAADMLTGLLGKEAPPHEPLVQFGPNSAIPHATAGARRLQPGDMVLFDLGAAVEGYLSDITRMTCFGKATQEMKNVYRTVHEAQQAAIAAAGPGVPCQEVDRAARRVITQAGYGGFFTHRTGHGLGLDVHETPYLVEGNDRLLEPGNVFTVEPGIYIPGMFGVRIEDDVLITEQGVEVLSAGQPDLVETR